MRVSAQPSKQNLQRLCMMRTILALALLAISAMLYLRTDVDLPWHLLLWVIGIMLAVNVLVFLRLRRNWPVTQGEFLLNLFADVVLLTVVLYYTGGSTNPLVSYFLIPLIISAAVLRPVYTWLLVLVTTSLYALLLFWFRPLALFESAGHHGTIGPHFIGMWINFGFSALLIAWFVVRMAQTLRDNEQAIAHSRETGLRDEQIISVANIAASTAHELRTPLATMAVLVDEMGDEHPEMRETTAILQQQIERCDSIIRRLVSTTAENGEVQMVTVAGIFRDVLEKWGLARPEIRLKTSLPGAIAALKIRCDGSLQLAFLNFLNNAADASPDHVLFQAGADQTQSTIKFVIEDHGPGIPPELAERLGKIQVSNKSGGLGLGVLLSQASIERLGGRVELFSDANSGTRLEISLPAYDNSDHA